MNAADTNLKVVVQYMLAGKSLVRMIGCGWYVLQEHYQGDITVHWNTVKALCKRGYIRETSHGYILTAAGRKWGA